MAEFAAEGDGEVGAGGVVAEAAAGHGAGDPEVAFAVRHLGDLGEDAAGGGERLVDRPQGAGAAEAGEVEVGGGLAFGDVAGPVHAQEGEGDAAPAGALEGAEAVADRFEADAEAGLEEFDVVVEFLGGRVEGGVRHEERAREVVGEADAGEGGGFG